jgi:regulatory protein
MSDPTRAAYSAALAMLSRRELSEAQLRERLARKEHDPGAIDAAIARLRDARAVDDRRVALAVARTEAAVKARGRARVLLKLRAIGIPPGIAEEAADEILGGLGEAALLERAIERRLRGPAAAITDPARFRRLLQQLIRQGFPPALVYRALKARSKGGTAPEDGHE